MIWGHARVDFHVEAVEFLLPIAERVEQRNGGRGDAFGRGRRRFLGDWQASIVRFTSWV